jgi:transposase
MHEQRAVTPSAEALLDEVERLREENAALRAVVAQQAALIEQLLRRVQELEARLAKDSHNSSKPPSSDGMKKPKSLRKAGKRPPGGQPGHRGSTLKRVADPARVVEHPLPPFCDACGRPLAGEVRSKVRQVFDLPPVRLEVTEHRTLEARCACGKVHRSAFPAAVAAPAQYGPQVKALAVHLTEHHMLPIERTARLLADCYGVPIAAATVMTMIREAEGILSPTAARIGEALAQAPVAGADETGLRVAGKLRWLHTAVTEALTWMGLHARRGKEAFAAFGILTEFTGTLVHDGWAPYRDLSCEHALCNAHHLRELTFVHEVCGQPWAKELIDCLTDANRQVLATSGQGLPQQDIEVIRRHYEAILSEGEAANPPAPPSGKRGRTRQSFPVNLLRRLRDHADDVLRFTRHPCVPFSNNLAEQAIRMPKVKQKVSGCFRTAEGAAAFCTIRSYLATLHKQGFDLLQSLTLSFQGNVPQPRLSG